MKILQINTTVNTGSTGRIVEDIGQLLIEKGHESYIAYSRKGQYSNSNLIRIGSILDMYLHGLNTRLFDRHGFASKKATKELVKRIDDLKPDIIALHNIHGYYLHVAELFKYLKGNQNIPVIWTLHDCWSYTGHCAYYSMEGCEKWKTHCKDCPQLHQYPQSLFFDNSFKSFDDKKKAFKGHSNLTIVTPSNWLKDQVNQSFLKDYPVKVIHNGVNLEQFRILDEEIQKPSIEPNKKIVLGVASVWEERKGLFDFYQLQEVLTEEFQIVLVGLSEKQIASLPREIIGITRTENIEELIEWYNFSDILVNPSKEETFGMVTVEAMACGTPVVGYNLTATPELITDQTGIVVSGFNIKELASAIESIEKKDKYLYAKSCRNRAEKFFSQENMVIDYYKLYQSSI